MVGHGSTRKAEWPSVWQTVTCKQKVTNHMTQLGKLSRWADISAKQGGKL